MPRMCPEAVRLAGLLQNAEKESDRLASTVADWEEMYCDLLITLARLKTEKETLEGELFILRFPKG